MENRLVLNLEGSLCQLKANFNLAEAVLSPTQPVRIPCPTSCERPAIGGKILLQCREIKRFSFSTAFGLT